MKEDIFDFTKKESENTIFTERSKLSDFSTIFVPLSLLVSLPPLLKLIMQLGTIMNLKISRYIFNKRFDSPLFCGASELAYAACIYVCGLITQETHLLVSKLNMAPLWPLTVPKFGLSAAFLNCNYSMLFYPFCRRSLELSWFQEIPRAWTTFIANCVKAIRDVLIVNR